MFAAHTSARHLKRGRAAQKRGNDAAAREAFADALRVARLGEAWAAAGEAASALGDLERDAGNLSAAEHHYRTGEVQYRRAPRTARPAHHEQADQRHTHQLRFTGAKLHSKKKSRQLKKRHWRQRSKR